MKPFTNSQRSQLEQLRNEKPRKVRVGGIVLARLGGFPPATECLVEAIDNTTSGEGLQEAELTTIRLFCKVLLRPSGRKLTGPDDMSVGPWEPGERRTVLLPGFAVEQVVS
jgi:hypothetical protein